MKWVLELERPIRTQETVLVENQHQSKNESGLDVQVLIPISEVEKSSENSESELESEIRPRKRRGRKPAVPLLKQVEQAYAHLYDYDWLQKSQLVDHEAVQERLNPRLAMAGARALQESLLRAAQEVLQLLDGLPNRSKVHVFLDRYISGKKVFEIADEMGIRT